MIDRELDHIERIGEAFGEEIAAAAGRGVMRTMTVERVDDNFAYCYIYEGDTALPVPLSFLGIAGASLKVTPTVGSLVSVALLNGNDMQPVLVGMGQVDRVEFVRSQSAVSVTVDPADQTKDTVRVAVGNSTVEMTQDLIAMNGGELGGLVVVGQLTERLNKLQTEIDNIQSAIASHTHLVSTTGSATAQTGTTTSTTYSRVSLTRVQDSDYVNEKVKQ